MKVRDLITLLEKSNPDAEVVIHRDNLNYGFGAIQYVRFGTFANTDYGNDFYPDNTMIINPSDMKAIALYPFDNDAPEKSKEYKDL